MSDLKDKRLFLLDMDGTIYLGNTIFDGTIDLLSYVRSVDGRYAFLTNNSSKGTESYIEKLGKMGIEAVPDDFVTSADATIDFLSGIKENAVIYLCGTESLKRQFRSAGYDVRDELSDDITLLLLGYDTELTYKKLEDCCRLLNRGIRYMATHPDMVCPTEYGYAPDCGSMIEMLKTATGRLPEEVIGKPRPMMAFSAMNKYGFTADQTCLIGDRIYTDIACAVNAGIDSIFVLSGEGVKEDIEKYDVHPTYIYDNVRKLVDDLRGKT
jgi:HAD superfamily hydrolase (TIGR01450 family)